MSSAGTQAVFSSERAYPWPYHLGEFLTLQQALQSAGVEATAYGHSFRIGAATTATKHGVDPDSGAVEKFGLPETPSRRACGRISETCTSFNFSTFVAHPLSMNFTNCTIYCRSAWAELVPSFWAGR